MSVIPQGWTVVPLAELTDRITKGTTPKTYGHQFQAEGIRFVRAESLSGREIDHNKCLHVSDEAHAEFQRSQLQPADVLVTIAGTLGRIALVKEQDTPANTNQAVAICRPSEKALAPYIARYLEGEITVKAVDSEGRGTGLQNLNLKQVGEFEIWVPPLPEQRRIVAKLDRLSARSAAARDHLARTTKLATRAKQAILLELLSGDWQSVPLVDLAKVGTGATPKKGTSRFYDGGEIPWVTSGAVKDFRILAAEHFITEAAIAETNCKVYPAGTLLMAMYGEGRTRGMVARLEIEAATNQALAAIQINPDAHVRDDWVIWVLHSKYLELRELASGGVQPNLNLGMVKSIDVPIPPLDEQDSRLRKIEAAFARIDRITEEASRAAHLLDRLDERLLAKAFAGELVPQDPEDEPAEALLTRIREARAAAPKVKRGRRTKAAAE